MQKKARPGRAFRSQTGQAMVELALALPVLVFGIAGGVDFGRVYAANLGAMNAARAGAEAAVIGAATTDVAILARALDELQSVPGLVGANAIITVTHPIVGAVIYTNVRVQYTFRTIIAWPLIPGSASIDRSASFRQWP